MHAGQIVPRAAHHRAGAGAYAQIECLVTLGTKLIQAHIPADFHACLKGHAHLSQYLNFRVHHVLFKPETRNAQGQHAAGHRRFFEHGDGIPPGGQIIGAAQARRPRSDDRNLIGIGPSGLVHHRRDKARRLPQLLLGNEFLNLVNGDRIVNAAAGAGILAPPVADPPANRREGVIGLDQLKGVPIPALGGQLDIALNRHMGGALGLAGRGAVADHLGAVGSVVLVVILAAPELFGRTAVRRFFRLGSHGAELPSQLYRIHLAGFHALAAGHASVLIHPRHVI